MRKLLCCVPMMILLLTACAGGPAGISEGEQLSLTIRGEYLEATAWTAAAAVTADYGQRVYRYEMAAASTGDETTLTLSAPEEVAGITAHVDGETGAMEYDGLWVETGPLDGDGLTPVSAVPALMEVARSGYITACCLEEGAGAALLRMDCGDPEGQPGTGVETVLWFDAATHALVRGEVSVDGFRVILCEFSDFTMG